VLDDPVRSVVGQRTAKVLNDGLGIATVEDLLRHYPRRYATRGELTDLATLREDEHVTVVAEIATVRTRSMKARRGSILEAELSDGKGRLSLTFFNQPYRARELVQGRRGLFSGKVGVYRGKRQLTHPDYEMFDDGGDDGGNNAEAVERFAGALIPVYQATAALPSWRIAQCLSAVLDTFGSDPEALPDPLPSDVRLQHGLPPFAAALVAIHRPATIADVDRARARFVFEEAFVLQVELARRRAATSKLPATPRVARSGGILASFRQALPFELTDGQRQVGEELAADLALDHPMHRLLQGEVGSGKTVVALLAMLAVVDAGGQAALLAPTEVLAQQHYRSLSAMLGPLARAGMLDGADVGTRIALLTGSQPTGARRSALLDVASGTAGIVVGTHALLQETVEFYDLGLVVVDEQHRFGVEQRAALTGRTKVPPHVLVMTATPIPRTVAMTVFGDLDVSTLTELPAGRPDVATHVVPAAEKPVFLQRTWDRVVEEVAAGHQVYVVCPRIGDGSEPGESGDDDDRDGADEVEDRDDRDGADDDDRDDRDQVDGADEPDRPAGAANAAERRPSRSVLDVAGQLRDGPLAGLRLEILHGRLAPESKDSVMQAFAAGTIDVLVATTVVEVGVDVANASTMVVMDADRFGVSQLHQLRGRVGRGSAPGLCLLVTEAAQGTPARERLDAVASTRDGFALARVDLEQRREGDVLGASQSGRRSSLRLLRVLRDEKVIAEARSDAAEVVAEDPDLASHPVLAAAVAGYAGDDRADFMEKT
jgi:ATP-dependent DNA helicase RecG